MPTNTTFEFSGPAIHANAAYDVTFWAWDSANDGQVNRTVTLTGTSGTSGASAINWTAGVHPTSNNDYSDTTTYTADASGVLTIEAADDLHLRIPGFEISAAIPEPSTLVLAACGLVSLLGFGRRRRR